MLLVLRQKSNLLKKQKKIKKAKTKYLRNILIFLRIRLLIKIKLILIIIIVYIISYLIII